MPTYVFLCDSCTATFEEQHRIANRPEHIICPNCGCPAPRIMQAPMVMEAALPDGVKRKGWAQLKEAAKLHTEAASAKADRKKEIAGEIKRLGVRMNKE